MFFEKKLKTHLLFGGNVGVVTGYGGLIVIDFDDADYQKEKDGLLPKTFTCRSAGKGLKHFYYLLKGDMISKIGIGLEKRLCDIQASKSPITCPPTSIKEKCYSVINDCPIAEIDYSLISKIFGIGLQKSWLKREIDFEPHPLKVEEAIAALIRLGIRRAKSKRFHCPFHESNGSGNLVIWPSGAIRCFHCNRFFNDAAHFENFYKKTSKELMI